MSFLKWLKKKYLIGRLNRHPNPFAHLYMTRVGRIASEQSGLTTACTTDRWWAPAKKRNLNLVLHPSNRVFPAMKKSRFSPAAGYARRWAVTCQRRKP